MPRTAINTRHVADRRTLRFGRLGDILADVEALDRSEHRRALGNWTPAQVVDHVAAFIDASLDGFPEAKLAAPLRWFGALMKSRALNRPLPAGFKIPNPLRARFAPKERVSWLEAVDHLRRTVGRVEAGERMTHPSPLLGELGHEQWVQMHCRHAEMHLSFIKSD